MTTGTDATTQQSLLPFGHESPLTRLPQELLHKICLIDEDGLDAATICSRSRSSTFKMNDIRSWMLVSRYFNYALAPVLIDRASQSGHLMELLSYAVLHNNVSLAQRILDHRSLRHPLQINAISTFHKPQNWPMSTALTWAVHLDRAEIVHALLKEGASPLLGSYFTPILGNYFMRHGPVYPDHSILPLQMARSVPILVALREAGAYNPSRWESRQKNPLHAMVWVHAPSDVVLHMIGFMGHRAFWHLGPVLRKLCHEHRFDLFQVLYGSKMNWADEVHSDLEWDRVLNRPMIVEEQLMRETPWTEPILDEFMQYLLPFRTQEAIGSTPFATATDLSRIERDPAGIARMLLKDIDLKISGPFPENAEESRKHTHARHLHTDGMELVWLLYCICPQVDDISLMEVLFEHAARRFPDCVRPLPAGVQGTLPLYKQHVAGWASNIISGIHSLVAGNWRGPGTMNWFVVHRHLNTIATLVFEKTGGHPDEDLVLECVIQIVDFMRALYKSLDAKLYYLERQYRIHFERRRPGDQYPKPLERRKKTSGLAHSETYLT
ncbi:hypothetical protein GGR56DRAFT_646773 [Xylariaceae sp. FL0804]|nr:hypothetical protein GGR56DRAFT_646773 [Xylariaceae sp. FL0804]